MLFLFLGFPFFWDKVIAVITGLCIGMLVYSLPIVEVPGTSRQTSSSERDDRQSYKEHRGVPQASMDSTSAPQDSVTTE
jgi:hypothetical protein